MPSLQLEPVFELWQAQCTKLFHLDCKQTNANLRSRHMSHVIIPVTASRPRGCAVQGGIRAAGLQAVRCIAHGNRHSLWFDIYHRIPAELRHLLPSITSGIVRAPSKIRAKRKALEIDEVAAEALLDKRASSWASQYARAPI